MAQQARTGFRDICEHYERLIRTGKLKPGHLLPTEPDLAKQHGVTRTTLRRAFAVLVRKGLVVKKPGQGTFIASKEELETRSTGVIAVLTLGSAIRTRSEPNDEMWGVSSSGGSEHFQVLEGVTTTLASYGRMTRTYYVQRDQDEWPALGQEIRKDGAAGIIAVGFELAAVDDVLSLGLPTVLVDSACEGRKTDAVQATNREGMAEATRHLLRTTQGPPVFVGSQHYQTVNPHTERRDGFMDACRKDGRAVPDDHIFYAEIHVNGGREIARDILRLSPLPQGIVCSDDRVAMGIIDVLRNEGLSVPNEVSVIGYGGSLIGLMVIPTISTVSPDRLRMGQEAVHLLEKRLKTPGRRSREVRVPTKLVLRGSTRRVP